MATSGDPLKIGEAENEEEKLRKRVSFLENQAREDAQEISRLKTREAVIDARERRYAKMIHQMRMFVDFHSDI